MEYKKKEINMMIIIPTFCGYYNLFMPLDGDTCIIFLWFYFFNLYAYDLVMTNMLHVGPRYFLDITFSQIWCSP